MTVGERLREARERQKVSLHAIAEKTNISVRFLDAIEKNQFDKLPGGIFTRGFIRSYASLVGLDPDGTVAQFLSDEPGQRDDDIDVAPASDREGLGLGTLVLAGLGVIALALALVYFFRPDWIGLQSTVSPPQEVTSLTHRASRWRRAALTNPPTAAPLDAGTPPAEGTTPAAPDGRRAAARDTAGCVARVGARSPEVAAAARNSPVGAVLGPVSADSQMRVASRDCRGRTTRRRRRGAAPDHGGRRGQLRLRAQRASPARRSARLAASHVPPSCLPRCRSSRCRSASCTSGSRRLSSRSSLRGAYLATCDCWPRAAWPHPTAAIGWRCSRS